MSKLTTIGAIILLAIIVAAALVAAVTYVLQTSNTITGDVTSSVVNIPVTLATNASTWTDLDALQLTASISDANGNGLTVHFYDNGTDIGNAVLSSNTASIVKTGLAVGHHVFTAGP